MSSDLTASTTPRPSTSSCDQTGPPSWPRRPPPRGALHLHPEPAGRRPRAVRPRLHLLPPARRLLLRRLLRRQREGGGRRSHGDDRLRAARSEWLEVLVGHSSFTQAVQMGRSGGNCQLQYPKCPFSLGGVLRFLSTYATLTS
nr:uncharacterized protein LOC113825344 [Penaeus vannamei]